MIKTLYRISKEKMYRQIAWMLPKTLVYWTAVRMFAHATTGQYGREVVPNLKAMDALKRWMDDHK